jgi:(Z)-2-((N-methylformamido)methylene)-5-hydroxybutyrolactone dehydrogenase
LAGWFIEPTIFTGVNNKKRLAQRKIFGPELSVVPFANDVAIANDTPYGLAAGMGTQAIRRSIIMSERPRVSTVRVNTCRAIGFMSPFGG